MHEEDIIAGLSCLSSPGQSECSVYYSDDELDDSTTLETVSQLIFNGGSSNDSTNRLRRKKSSKNLLLTTTTATTTTPTLDDSILSDGFDDSEDFDETTEENDLEKALHMLETFIMTCTNQALVFQAYELICVVAVKLNDHDLLCTNSLLAITSVVGVDLAQKRNLFFNVLGSMRSTHAERYNIKLLSLVYKWLVDEIVNIVSRREMNTDNAMSLHQLMDFLTSILQPLSYSCVKHNRSSDLTSIIKFAQKMRMPSHFPYMCFLVLQPPTVNNDVILDEFNRVVRDLNNNQRDEYAKLVVYHYYLHKDWDNLLKFFKRMIYGIGVTFPGAYECMLCCSIILDYKLDPYLKLLDIGSVQCCKYLHMAYDLNLIEMFDKMLLNCYPFIQCRFPFASFSFSWHLEQARQRMVDRVKENTCGFVVRVRNIGYNLPTEHSQLVCLGALYIPDTSDEHLYFYSPKQQQVYQLSRSTNKWTSNPMKVSADFKKGKILINPSDSKQFLYFINNSAYLFDSRKSKEVLLRGSGDVILNSSFFVFMIDQTLSHVYRFVDDNFLLDFEYAIPTHRLLNFCLMDNNSIIVLSIYEVDTFYTIDLIAKTQTKIVQLNQIPSHLLKGACLMQYMSSNNALFCTFAKESGFIGACMFSFQSQTWCEVRVVGDLITSFSLLSDVVHLNQESQPSYILTRGKHVRRVLDSANILAPQETLSFVDICLSSNYEWTGSSQKVRMFTILLQGQASACHTSCFLDVDIVFK